MTRDPKIGYDYLLALSHLGAQRVEWGGAQWIPSLHPRRRKKPRTGDGLIKSYLYIMKNNRFVACFGCSQ